MNARHRTTLRRLFDTKHLWDVIVHQQHRIHTLEADVAAAELAYMRISRDLIEQFLIAIDRPEDNDVIRERLVVGLGFYRDEIAVREEHS